MTNLDHSFKFFNKSLSIFQIADEFYSFNDYKKKFHERYDEFPEQIVVTSELDRIYTNYAAQEGPAWLGYSHRKEGRHHPLATFEFDFDDWAKESRHIFELSLKINRQDTSQENVDRLIEDMFVSLLTQGINDAQLENYLFGLIYPKPVKKEIFDDMILPDKKNTLMLLFQRMELLSPDGSYELKNKPGDLSGTRFQATISALIETNHVKFFFVKDYKKLKDIIGPFYRQMGFEKFTYSKSDSKKYKAVKKEAIRLIHQMAREGKLARNP